MRNSIRWKDLELPWRILDKLINDYIEGRLGGDSPIEVVAVLEIDNEGGQLAGPGTDRTEQTPNPRGSFLGRVITNAADKDTPDESLGVFWPMNQHDVMPIKQGESAIVMYLDMARTHGLWLCRSPEPNEIHNLNFTSLTERFRQDSDNDLTSDESGTAHQAVQDLEEDPGVPTVDPNFDVEKDDVPEFNQRSGDRVIHGSNNTTIIMSRDRVDTADSGLTEKAGTIDVVAGRIGQDISHADDAARFIVSMKTSGDANFAVDGFGEDAGESAYAIAKGDEVRIIGRNSMKLVVESGPTSVVIGADGKVTIETVEDVELTTQTNVIVNAEDITLDAGGTVNVGTADASHPLVRGDKLKDYLKAVFDIIVAMPIDVATIPAIGVPNSAVSTGISQLDTMYEDALSNDNKVE